MERITLSKPYRYGRDASGRTKMLHAGTYVVGKQIKKELAAQILKDRAGVRVVQPSRPAASTKMRAFAPENKAGDGPRHDHTTMG